MLDDDLSERVKDYVYRNLQKVRPAGPENLVACCPFHNDKSPSFAINYYNGLWLCYACGVSGNFRSFLMKLGMSDNDIRRHYGRTIERLKENAPPPPDPSKPGIVADTNRHVPEELLGLFNNKCPTKLVNEGFSKATLKHFCIGVDTKHDRITFPLRDIEGHLVGISGRAIRENVDPRYKVYAREYEAWELPPYDTDKDVLLWNGHALFDSMRAQLDSTLILVEGFKACMWLHQAGITNVAALMTKRISWAQMLIVTQMCHHVVIMPDNDDPGIDGVVQVCGELSKKMRDIRIVEYDYAQPTDVPQEDLPELVNSATDYMEMVLE